MKFKGHCGCKNIAYLRRKYSKKDLNMQTVKYNLLNYLVSVLTIKQCILMSL